MLSSIPQPDMPSPPSSFMVFANLQPLPLDRSLVDEEVVSDSVKGSPDVDEVVPE
ncbi:hypothetical protein RchiOBHm_Chr1g0342321 [Rosa chinensis]|uniref:Uncharacterized protein n=1 Tax=Rosa chinensis TaxID=74649 RepID=A0A2P6SDZ7_ROSCH|nr:hypothetical protein RchiOBHm_Chr1g0342321 [Rosa chinensis]